MKFLFLLWKHPVEPLGLMYISSVLKKAGHETKAAIIDHETQNYANIFKAVENFKPDIVAGSVMTGGQTMFLDIIKQLKKKHNFLSLMGGIHPTFYPKEIESEGLDIISLGEAEDAIVELANNLEQGKDITKIKNLWIKQKGKIYKNDISHLIEDIDSIPFPDRELVYEHDVWRNEPIRHFVACRGCAYRCSYCFNNTMAKVYKDKGNWVRWRSVDSLIQEIKGVLENYGGEMVYFQDDIFIMNKPWLREFAQKYKKEIDTPFHCHVRPNLVDKESARLLKEAGCYSVHMALEAADDRIRNPILKRNMPKETVYDAAKYLHENDIKIMLQNMIGLPTGTLRSDFATLEMNIKINPTYAWCSIFQPYPLLELTEFAVKEGLLEGDYNDIGPKFFETTVLKIPHKNQAEHLQKWFALTSDFPFIYYSGLLHLLINMPRNGYVKKFYSWIYKKHRDWKDNNLYGVKLN